MSFIKDGVLSMKRLLSIICILSLLTACNASSKLDFLKADYLTSAEFASSKQLKQDIVMQNKQLKMPKKANVAGFALSKDSVFYVLDYAHLFVDQTNSGKVPKFIKEYQTSIRAYNLSTEEEKEIFRFSNADYKEISDLQVVGDYLFFVDYKDNYLNHDGRLANWQFNLLDLRTHEVKRILEKELQKFSQYSFSVEARNAKLILSVEDFSGKDKHSFVYDVVNTKFKEVKEAKEIQQISSDGLKFTWQTKPQKKLKVINNSGLIVEASELNVQTKKTKQLKVLLPSPIINPVFNEQYLVYAESRDFKDHLYALDYVNGKLLNIKAASIDANESKKRNYFSDYELVGNKLLAIQTNSIYLYDLTTQTCQLILDADLEGVSLHELQRSDDTFCVRYTNNCERADKTKTAASLGFYTFKIGH